MITLLVITDGRRDCIAETIPSADQSLHGDISHRIIYDDSGDPENREWLTATFPHFDVHQHPDGRQGFGGAIRAAWSIISTHTTPYVFHLEDDFTFNRPVDLHHMAWVLDHNPYVAQMALRRQPWNAQERAAGGIVEQHPDDFHDRYTGQHPWLEHRRFFTTNPCLYRRSLLEVGWPEGPESEGHFSIQLRDAGYSFGFWGSRESGEWARHIGHERVGTGY